MGIQSSAGRMAKRDGLDGGDSGVETRLEDSDECLEDLEGCLSRLTKIPFREVLL